MSKSETTPVVFRVWTDTLSKQKSRLSAHAVDEVFALFPTISADNRGEYCCSYAIAGGHGSADYHFCIRRSRPATPKEYADLKDELEQLNYILRVIQRATHQHHQQRQTITSWTNRRK